MSSEFERDFIAEAATLLAHDEPFPGGAVVPPIYQTSLFTFDSYADMADVFAGRSTKPIYSRGNNPTVMEFESKIAALEGAEAARGFSSGMAAISSTVLAFVGSGERIVAVRNCYGDAYRLFERLLPHLGIKVDYVDGSDPEAVAAALPGAAMLYLESPTSMMFELQELEALTAMARARGIVSVIDNSWATPLFQKPILHGVDIVMHSASKYLGGHSDTVAGVVAGSAEHIRRINERTYPYLGAKLSPFEAWLLLRGLRTLPLRLPHHMKSALVIAERLKGHAHVERVNHPAFSNHPGKKTLSGYSGLFSFEVTDDIDVPAFTDALKLFRIGVSWGGHESLVVPALASLQQTPDANSIGRFGVSPRTIRLNVGLENVEDLWADVSRAFGEAKRK
ncbi:cystathionine beta-lyase/cystathionine gamma-synthase [Aminobacter aminovorans]|uniref:Cystathionine gamma-synthase n=1 Tax=Aminobacter aminovorans TaxID=83263 RepID=A0A380WEE2_AMIAI|nr:PLP-dependent transferase [Aminobacter aminovorans]TCS23454.1 cystathionine beta-lyase/cystathionine gamma-synthase [Aminobacter aminovorans]SUU87330.1 Cystathionine gamma-synthase [Aminobacter aminovorans]